ncbi:transposase [Nocardia salmonicida]|uniref:transposase n=1 Tax=Nocardia salmonicida TaxID=53431 RepID=UPI0009FE7EFA
MLPKTDGCAGSNFSNDRLVVEGMLYWLRTGMPWRYLPKVFGPRLTVWKRRRPYACRRRLGSVWVASIALSDAIGNLSYASRGAAVSPGAIIGSAMTDPALLRQ